MYQGKVAVVTGAAGGLGRALCAGLVERGAQVWALDLKPEAIPVQEGIHPLKADVTDPTSLEKALDQVLKENRRLEFWFNNAGLGERGSLRKSSDTSLRRMLDVNVLGVMNGTRVALDHMETMGGGVVVNVASVAGFVPAPFLSVYSATKHAVVGLTRAVREELRLECSTTRLVLVSPGFVDTAMIGGETGLPFPEWLKWVVGSPEEVAKETLQKIARGEDEIAPTWNGKLMLVANKVAPKSTLRTSKVLLARRFSDWVLNRYDLP